VRNAVRVHQWGVLAGASVLALLSLDIPSANAQSPQASTPPTFAPVPPSKPAAATPAAATQPKQNSQPVVSVPTPSPKPDPTALPTTHVVAGANANSGGGRMLNPYSDQPETKYIKIPVSSAGCNAARAPGKPYFVEFRSRSALSFGHTFALYGRLGEGNRFASYKIAGLHPKGDSANYTMGLWFPVDAETGPSDGDVDEQFMTAHYCVTLTEAEYNRLVPYIKQLQSEHKTWHGPTYNCNSFGMDIAKFVGLDTPNPNANLPKDLIERLAELNKNRPRNMTALSSAPSGALSVRR